MRRRVALAGGIAALACLVPAVAVAEETITGAPSNRYENPNIEIDQGETVMFRNTDVASHDVTSRDKGPDGKRLFASETIGQNKTVKVEGVEYLSTGAYQFFCTIHPSMTGTITVNTNGTPVPRPGATPTPTADPLAPVVSLRLGIQRASKLKSKRRLTFDLGVDKSATVAITASIGGKRVGSLKEQFEGSPGRAEITLRLSRSKAAGKLLRKGVKMTVRVTATTPEGRVGRLTRSIRLK